MLRALKWAYDIGVRQERTRIAAQLQGRQQGARFEEDMMQDMLRRELDRPKPRKHIAERLEFQKAVVHRVDQIIDEIFRPNGEYIPTSVMFPEREDIK